MAATGAAGGATVVAVVAGAGAAGAAGGCALVAADVAAGAPSSVRLRLMATTANTASATSTTPPTTPPAMPPFCAGVSAPALLFALTSFCTLSLSRAMSSRAKLRVCAASLSA
ncbi:MAG: hypothetical protein EOO41_02605 [Methanobacteriota archaeon]|nr:MAG: hypothetical protein EOO41_02605 [Euryarchaeota archaeon]